MNIEVGVIVGLVIYCILRELFFVYSTHKLLNKLMSRNYHEFVFAQNEARNSKAEAAPQAHVSNGLEEDFGTLTGIG